MDPNDKQMKKERAEERQELAEERQELEEEGELEFEDETDAEEAFEMENER